MNATTHHWAVGADELAELYGTCGSCEQPQSLHRGFGEHCPNTRKGSVLDPLCKHPCEQNGKLSFKLTYPEFPHTPQGNADFLNLLAADAGIARSITNVRGYHCTAEMIA